MSPGPSLGASTYGCLIQTKFAISSVCKAFDEKCIGTRVRDKFAFLCDLHNALQDYEMPANGQGFVNMDRVIDYVDGESLVSGGVARRVGLEVDDVVVREHRGELGLYAKRVFAENPEHVNVVVYTADAYRNDPQVKAEDPQDLGDATHVVVAVLATVGPKPPVGSHRFVRNLAGGNASYFPENGYTLDKAIATAKEIVEYEQQWITVAD